MAEQPNGNASRRPESKPVDELAATEQVKTSVPTKPTSDIWPGLVPPQDEAEKILRGAAKPTGHGVVVMRKLIESLGPTEKAALADDGSSFDLSVLRGGLVTRFRIEVAAAQATPGGVVDAEALGDLLGEVDAVIDLLQI